MSIDDDDDDDLGLIFQDPPGFYPPTPPPTVHTCMLSLGGRQMALTLGVVGHSPLEGHNIWNGARAVTRFFEQRPSLVRGRDVLEVGAGAGLPSLACAVLGARTVVASDYPDPELLGNLHKNADYLKEGLRAAAATDARCVDDVVRIEGYIWGSDAGGLLKHVDSGGFDAVIMTDLLFRHSEHANLVKTIRLTLRRRRESAAYVFFTSHRPWLVGSDLAFFDTARRDGFRVDRIVDEAVGVPLFETDLEELQKRVVGWTVRWDIEL